MGSTIIDSLIVELGLDPSKLDEGKKKAVQGLRDLEAQAERSSQNVNRSTGKMEQGFSLLQKRLLAVTSLFLGGMGVQQFTQYVTRLNTALSNTSQTLGVQAGQLRAWQQAAERFGLSGDAATSGFSAITQQRSRWQNQREPGALWRFQYGASQNSKNPVNLFGKDGNLLPDEEVSMRLSRWLQTETRAGRGVQGQAALRDIAGLPQEFVQLLSKGPEEIQRILAETKKIAPNSTDIENFKKLNEAFERTTQLAARVGTAVVSIFSPDLVQSLEHLANFLTKIIPDSSTKAQIERREKRIREIDDRLAGQKGVEFRNTPFLKNERDRLTEEIKKLRETMERSESGLLQKQSFPGGGDNGGFPRVMKASWSGGSSGSGGLTPSGNGIAGDDTAGRKGSDYLAARRAGMKREIENDPQLRKELGGMMLLEGTPLHTMESLANRTDYVNSERAKRGLPPLSLRQMLHSGFYGPINRGQLPGAVRRLESNPGLRAKMDEAIDRVLRGSNEILGATDQGMPSDPNGRWPGGRMYYRGNVFNDWGGGPGGHEGARRYREMIQRGVREGDAARRPAAPTGDQWTRLYDSVRVAGVGSDLRSYSNSMVVGDVHVHSAATDAPGIASSIRPELERFADIMSSNNGPA